MSAVRFVEELPKEERDGRGPRDWRAVYASLAEQPGTWALVAECANPNVAQYMRANYGRHVAKRDGLLEVVTRANRVVDGKRVCDVYARFAVTE